jgi:hypothetical protein
MARHRLISVHARVQALIRLFLISPRRCRWRPKPADSWRRLVGCWGRKGVGDRRGKRGWMALRRRGCGSAPGPSPAQSRRGPLPGSRGGKRSSPTATRAGGYKGRAMVYTISAVEQVRHWSRPPQSSPVLHPGACAARAVAKYRPLVGDDLGRIVEDGARQPGLSVAVQGPDKARLAALGATL